MKASPDPRDVALGLAVVCGRAGVTAGKVALVPLRVAAASPLFGAVLGRTQERLADTGRTARTDGLNRLEAIAGEALDSPEAEHAVDRALAGPLPEAVARLVVERHVVQRVAEQVLVSAEADRADGQLVEQTSLDQLVGDALESRVVADITDRVIESAELQRIIEEVASSPAVRAALANQTSSLAGELVDGIRHRMEHLDDRASRGRTVPTARVRFGGLGTRGVAFAVDLAITLLIFLTGTGLAALVAVLVGGIRPQWLAQALALIGWTMVIAAYLVTFWTVIGQTPGMRLMHLRVVDHRGNPPGVGRSLLRLVGLGLAIIPAFAGFIPVLFDGRRRALQDYLAGTVVYSEQSPEPQLSLPA